MFALMYFEIDLVFFQDMNHCDFFNFKNNILLLVTIFRIAFSSFSAATMKAIEYRVVLIEINGAINAIRILLSLIPRSDHVF